MKKEIFIALLVLTSTNSFSTEVNGKHLFTKMCLSCHVVQGKPTSAPPIFAVKNHVIQQFSSRDAFVKKVTDWVAHPKAENTVMPGAVNRFGLMPQLNYDAAKVKKIAEFLYDTDLKLPNWYKKHYQEQHGELPK